MVMRPVSRADHPLLPVGLDGQLNDSVDGTVSSNVGPVSASAGVPLNCSPVQYVTARPVNGAPSGLDSNDWSYEVATTGAAAESTRSAAMGPRCSTGSPAAS